LADEPVSRYGFAVQNRWKTLAAIALAVLFLDQWTKLLAVKHLTPGFVLDKIEKTTGERPKRTPTREEREATLDSIGVFENLALFYAGTKSPCGDRSSRCAQVIVFEDFWSWRYAENPGAAWSLFAKVGKELRVPFLITVSIFALLVILYYIKNLTPDQRTTLIALSLIFGGAAGNLADRARLGYVIDFIHWYRGTTSWPTFNVADSAISTGVALLALTMILELRPKRARALGEADAVR
jgi:signal peptidase II